jgi:integrase
MPGWCAVTIYRRTWRTASGRTSSAWLLERMIDGKRVRRQFPSAAEAAEAAARPTPAERHAENDYPTVAALASAYLREAKSRGLERSTREGYGRHLDLHLLPMIGSLPPESIDRAVAIRVMDTLSATLSPALARATFSTLQRLVRHAHNVGAISTNPIIGLRFLVGREKREGRRYEKARVPNKPQIAEIVSKIEWGDGRRRPHVTRVDIVAALGLYAGLRPSETRGLRVRDVVILDEVPYVRVRQRADIYNQIGPVKTPSAIRDVPIPQRVFDQIQSFVRQHDVRPDGLLLRARGGESPFDYSNFVARDWRRFLRTSSKGTAPVHSGITTLSSSQTPDSCDGDTIRPPNERITLHALRHCFASLQIEQGVVPKTLQHRMGHSTIQTTLDLYGHLWVDRARDATDAEQHAAAIDEILRRFSTGGPPSNSVAATDDARHRERRSTRCSSSD